MTPVNDGFLDPTASSAAARSPSIYRRHSLPRKRDKEEGQVGASDQEAVVWGKTAKHVFGWAWILDSSVPQFDPRNAQR